jgi:hypothetical protein
VGYSLHLRRECQNGNKKKDLREKQQQNNEKQNIGTGGK